MRYNKLLSSAFLSLLFLISSCKKDSNSPKPQTPSIVGNWNLEYQSDTLFNIPQTVHTTITNSTNLYGSIKFESDGTVYTTTSFVMGTGVNGTTVFFAVALINPVITDTAKYTTNNNVISFTASKYRSAYKDTIQAIDNNKLVLSNFSTSVYKTTDYYTK
ncbi:MAG TPA: hypothetical protein VGI61_06700 [Parafilimonas sp.]